LIHYINYANRSFVWVLLMMIAGAISLGSGVRSDNVIVIKAPDPKQSGALVYECKPANGDQGESSLLRSVTLTVPGVAAGYGTRNHSAKLEIRTASERATFDCEVKVSRKLGESNSNVQAATHLTVSARVDLGPPIGGSFHIVHSDWAHPRIKRDEGATERGFAGLTWWPIDRRGLIGGALASLGLDVVPKALVTHGVEIYLMLSVAAIAAFAYSLWRLELAAKNTELAKLIGLFERRGGMGTPFHCPDVVFDLLRLARCCFVVAFGAVVLLPMTNAAGWTWNAAPFVAGVFSLAAFGSLNKLRIRVGHSFAVSVAVCVSMGGAALLTFLVLLRG